MPPRTTDEPDTQLSQDMHVNVYLSEIGHDMRPPLSNEGSNPSGLARPCIGILDEMHRYLMYAIKDLAQGILLEHQIYEGPFCSADHAQPSILRRGKSTHGFHGTNLDW